MRPRSLLRQKSRHIYSAHSPKVARGLRSASRQPAEWLLHYTNLVRVHVMWLGVIMALLLGFAPRIARGQDNAASQRLNAGDVEVVLRVAPTRTSTAGKVTAELEVTAPASAFVEIASSETQSRNPLTVVSETSSGPLAVRPGWMQYRKRIEYRPFLGGSYELPAFAVSHRSPAGAAQLLTSPVPLIVSSVIDGDPATAEPAGIVPVPTERASRWTFVAWTGAAALALAVAGSFYFRQRARKLPLPPPTQPPIETALATIQTLAMEDVRGLEGAIETLRAKGHDPLPRLLDDAYQWIRFGSPTPRDLERFRTGVMRHLRRESLPDEVEKHG